LTKENRNTSFGEEEKDGGEVKRRRIDEMKKN